MFCDFTITCCKYQSIYCPTKRMLQRQCSEGYCYISIRSRNITHCNIRSVLKSAGGALDWLLFSSCPETADVHQRGADRSPVSALLEDPLTRAALRRQSAPGPVCSDSVAWRCLKDAVPLGLLRGGMALAVPDLRTVRGKTFGSPAGTASVRGKSCHPVLSAVATAAGRRRPAPNLPMEFAKDHE